MHVNKKMSIKYTLATFSAIIASRLTIGRPMSSLLNKWNDFREFAYSDEILIALGAVIFIVSILKVIKSSFTTFLWLALSGMGILSVSQGFDRNPFVAAAVKHSPVASYVESGREISSDALDILCRKMQETERLQLE